MTSTTLTRFTSGTFALPVPTTKPAPFAKIIRAASILFGVNADKSNDFVGLDLHGRAMWSKAQ